MFLVHPDKAIREKAQVAAQEHTKLALDQGIYSALKSLPATSADPTTKHYLERSLLEYGLAPG